MSAEEPDLTAVYPELARLEAPPAGEQTDYLRESVWTMIAPGFTTFGAAFDAVADQAEDEGFAHTRSQLSRIVTEAWLRRSHQLAAPAARVPTDDARVQAAFDALRDEGLIAEMDCGYTQDEASDTCVALARDRGAPGYVFFHRQDTERLVEPGATLYLGFDAVAPGGGRFADRAAYDAAAATIGRRVATALTDRGLTVAWDGTCTSRVEVTGLDWRRPLPD